MQGLLPDLPTGLIEVVLLTVFPEATVSELETIFCSDCMTNVVSKEDLEDPAPGGGRSGHRGDLRGRSS